MNNLNIDNNEDNRQLLYVPNFANISNYEPYMIKISQLKNTHFYYPINFGIINELTSNKIIKVFKNLDNITKQYLFEEICLKPDNDGFFFRSNKNNSIFDKNNNLIIYIFYL